MPGDPDPLYVKARKVLLDAFGALEDHREALVLSARSLGEILRSVN